MQSSGRLTLWISVMLVATAHCEEKTLGEVNASASGNVAADSGAAVSQPSPTPDSRNDTGARAAAEVSSSPASSKAPEPPQGRSEPAKNDTTAKPAGRSQAPSTEGTSPPAAAASPKALSEAEKPKAEKEKQESPKQPKNINKDKKIKKPGRPKTPQDKKPHARNLLENGVHRPHPSQARPYVKQGKPKATRYSAFDST